MAGVLLGLWSGAVWWGAGRVRPRARCPRSHGDRAGRIHGYADHAFVAGWTAYAANRTSASSVRAVWGAVHPDAPVARAAASLRTVRISGRPGGGCYPAVSGDDRILASRADAAGFLQLHVLVALTPVMLWRAGKPLPTDPRRALVLASGYLLAVAALNRALHTNYLFLSAAPAGTPLQWLYARGGGYYVCALSMLCMTLFRLLADAYRRAAISGNR